MVNHTARRVAGWVSLNARGAHVQIMDPLTGQAGLAAVDAKAPSPRVYLQLESGESLILRTSAIEPRLPRWRYLEPAGELRRIAGPWNLEFVAGGPELPGPAQLDSLGSWTALEERAARFSGSARYRVTFDVPAPAGIWRLELGDVRETARVTLNGRLLGTVWSLPAWIDLGSLRARDNQLEIEVTNLPANRVRDLDLRKVDWKVMKDINLASLRYRALDASTWEPQPSGLLGPVRLVRLKSVSPGR